MAEVAISGPVFPEGWKVHVEQTREEVGSKGEEISRQMKCVCVCLCVRAESGTLKGEAQDGHSLLSHPSLFSSCFARCDVCHKGERKCHVSLREQTGEERLKVRVVRI